MAGETLSFNFKGSAITILGSMYPAASTYEVSIDDGPARIHNATLSLFTNPVMLYFQGGLNPDVQHTLTLKNLEAKPVSVDSFVVHRCVNLTLPFHAI